MISFCDFFMSNLTESSVDHKWNALKSTMERNIPTKSSSSRFHLPWFNRTHRRLCKKKQRLYNDAKRLGNETDWAKYRSVKKKLRQELKKARNVYVSGFLSDAIQENPKSFWSYIKKTKRCDQVGVPDLKVDGSLTSDPFCKAKALNDQFCSVFTKENTSTYAVLPPSN